MGEDVKAAEQQDPLQFLIDHHDGQVPFDKGTLLDTLQHSRAELAGLKVAYFLRKAGVKGAAPDAGNITQIAMDIADKQKFIEVLCIMVQDIVASGDPIPQPSKLEIVEGVDVPVSRRRELANGQRPAPR